MERIAAPFAFAQCIGILKATGKKAKSLGELRSAIEGASDGSIYHHTCQYMLSGHILEYTNDFAFWAGECLGERVLAEHLSNIDPYEFSDMQELRRKLLEVIDDYLNTFPEPREAVSEDEFYFQETVTLIFPEGVRANNLAEFLIAIRFIDSGSLYYHFYEARSRLGRGRDDFSTWFDEALGNKELAEKMRAIDPFMHTIEGIRAHIIEAVEDAVKKDMEVIPQ
jgi:hypothetical protein